MPRASSLPPTQCSAGRVVHFLQAMTGGAHDLPTPCRLRQPCSSSSSSHQGNHEAGNHEALACCHGIAGVCGPLPPISRALSSAVVYPRSLSAPGGSSISQDTLLLGRNSSSGSGNSSSGGSSSRADEVPSQLQLVPQAVESMQLQHQQQQRREDQQKWQQEQEEEDGEQQQQQEQRQHNLHQHHKQEQQKQQQEEEEMEEGAILHDHGKEQAIEKVTFMNIEREGIQLEQFCTSLLQEQGQQRSGQQEVQDQPGREGGLQKNSAAATMAVAVAGDGVDLPHHHHSNGTHKGDCGTGPPPPSPSQTPAAATPVAAAAGSVPCPSAPTSPSASPASAPSATPASSPSSPSPSLRVSARQLKRQQQLLEARRMWEAILASPKGMCAALRESMPPALRTATLACASVFSPAVRGIGSEKGCVESMLLTGVQGGGSQGETAVQKRHDGMPAFKEGIPIEPEEKGRVAIDTRVAAGEGPGGNSVTGAPGGGSTQAARESRWLQELMREEAEGGMEEEGAEVPGGNTVEVKGQAGGDAISRPADQLSTLCPCIDSESPCARTCFAPSHSSSPCTASNPLLSPGTPAPCHPVTATSPTASLGCQTAGWHPSGHVSLSIAPGSGSHSLRSASASLAHRRCFRLRQPLQTTGAAGALAAAATVPMVTSSAFSSPLHALPARPGTFPASHPHQPHVYIHSNASSLPVSVPLSAPTTRSLCLSPASAAPSSGNHSLMRPSSASSDVGIPSDLTPLQLPLPAAALLPQSLPLPPAVFLQARRSGQVAAAPAAAAATVQPAVHKKQGALSDAREEAEGVGAVQRGEMGRNAGEEGAELGGDGKCMEGELEHFGEYGGHMDRGIDAMSSGTCQSVSVTDRKCDLAEEQHQGREQQDQEQQQMQQDVHAPALDPPVSSLFSSPHVDAQQWQWEGRHGSLLLPDTLTF